HTTKNEPQRGARAAVAHVFLPSVGSRRWCLAIRSGATYTATVRGGGCDSAALLIATNQDSVLPPPGPRAWREVRRGLAGPRRRQPLKRKTRDRAARQPPLPYSKS